MFLSVEWAKRWLPAIFLSLSSLLPWSTFLDVRHGGWVITYRSFLWAEGTFSSTGYEMGWLFTIQFSQLFYICFISALILTAGLCGFSSKNKTRRIGGLLGILSILCYFIFIFPNRDAYRGIGHLLNLGNPKWHLNQFFGVAYYNGGNLSAIWFLSVGFYLALAGSLMLLSPIIRTLIERLRERL